MGENAFCTAAGILPRGMAAAAMSLPEPVQSAAEEIRLRLGRRPVVILPEGERPIHGADVVTGAMLREVVERAGRWSLHTILEQMRRGYLTLEGGHRLGLCGTAVMEDGEVITLRDVTSANLRIAREIRGDAGVLASELYRDGALRNVLILGPPGAGKTTLLRDLIRTLSDGEGDRPGLRVAVADERGELAGSFGHLALGARTDVLSGCPKAIAIPMLLRAMSPQVVAVDEITVPADICAMEQAMGCGAALLATAHGSGTEDLKCRPLYRRMMERGIFHTVITIRVENGRRVTQSIPAEELT